MSDILSIGASATQLYRQSLATVSNNIANLNTDGYSRQVSSSAEGMPSQQGTVFIGTGARLEGVVRAYDEFIENSLRNSSSDLSTQEPLIQYANRIVDLMGSQTSGLSSALDRFFAAASNLSADPASTVARNLFVRDADALASRFRELSGQLDSIELEVRSGIEQEVGRINTLSTQLATVNRQLAEKISIDKQPPQLLDQRDKILRDLAKITKIHLTEDASGVVAVRLGSSSGTLIVNETQAIDLGVKFDPYDTARVDIISDPYRDAYAASTISSGTLGGLINLRSQTLGQVMDSFDHLAQVFVQEVNQIHTSGIDSRGERGKLLFDIDPIFEVTSPTVNNQVNLDIEVTDPDSFEFSAFTMRWMAEQGQWEIQQQKSGVTTYVQPDHDGFDYGGLKIKTQDSLAEGDTFVVQPVKRPAAGLRLSETDPLAIAAAKRLRAMADTDNISEVKVSLDIQQQSADTVFKYGQSIYELGNNSGPAAGIEVDASNLKPSFIIPRGAENAVLMMEVPQDSNLRLQAITANSVHILGHSIDSATQDALRSEDTGFVQGSDYSDTYLNQQDTDAYKDLDITYGFLASSSQQRSWKADSDGTTMIEQLTAVDALVQTQPVRDIANNTGLAVDLIAADSLQLNGQTLSALSLPDGEQNSAALIADWLNSATATTGVTATAINEIRATADDIDLLQQLTINGTLVAGVPTTVDELSAAINAVSAATQVISYVSREGGLVLTNETGHEGEAIVLGNPDATSSTNALGQSNQVYTGALQLESTDKIRFTFDSDGEPANLAVLGLRTGLYINGTVDEEIAVFVTGTGTASVAAGFASNPDTEIAPNESPFKIEFLSNSQYSITDIASDTVLATRDYAAGDTIGYGSVTLEFDSAPSAGDSFVVDGNEDGVGDNGNMLLIVDLQNKPVLDADRSISDGYIDLVTDVGNAATLGKISQEALQVVYDQAVESRDRVSGVSLDQEAADLIRFQQAYQASAQIIQMSSKIFDSILAIR
jgi:flagellar hook-associated protein FlgK